MDPKETFYRQFQTAAGSKSNPPYKPCDSSMIYSVYFRDILVLSWQNCYCEIVTLFRCKRVTAGLGEKGQVICFPTWDVYFRTRPRKIHVLLSHGLFAGGISKQR